MVEPSFRTERHSMGEVKVPKGALITARRPGAPWKTFPSAASVSRHSSFTLSA
jgi:hypothetical protein